MADDIRTAARDAAYAFINDPTKSDEINNPLAALGMFAMLFPDVKSDWTAAEMISEAFTKMKAAEEGRGHETL